MMTEAQRDAMLAASRVLGKSCKLYRFAADQNDPYSCGTLQQKARAEACSIIDQMDAARALLDACLRRDAGDKEV